MEKVADSQHRYERRERAKSEKGKLAEQQAALVKENKLKKKKRKQSLCKSCSKIIPGNSTNNNACSKCSEPLHYRCAKLVVDDASYCTDCTRTIPWDEVEDFGYDVPKSAKLKRSAALQ